jgi:NAD(P)-dependent dehydrogenase (short-subunit alcohol dehydrogenase family)
LDINKLFDLHGRTALVTGGNAGIGAAIAQALGSAGARVVLVARRQTVLNAAANALQSQRIDVHTRACDLSDLPAARACALEVARQHGPIDILVNAAGINLRQPFDEITPETWQQQLTIQLSAPFFLTQALAPQMKAHGYGRILNIASLQSFRAFDRGAPYGAAKGGIVQLTRAVAQAWSMHGITCNAIGPGFFPTDLTAPIFDDPALADRHAKQTCIGRNGRLEDLYGIAVFLASEASAYITGQTIMVDGGYTAR